MAKFVHEGRSIDYVPTADVNAGDVVVLGEIVGVATRSIPANRLGALQVEGVFDFPKGSGAIGLGVVCYWNETGKVATTVPGEGGVNKKIGVSVAAAATGDSTVRIKIK